MIKQKIRAWTQQIKRYVYALFLAYRDDRIPTLTKLLLGLIIAYALSPIDLIPDFIPVLGYLDDLILLPIFIYIAMRMIPKAVWQDCLAKAEQQNTRLPNNVYGAIIVILIWVGCLLGLSMWWLASKG